MNQQACIRLFLCGDVMSGRGVDQVLPHASDPEIYEPFMGSALGYVILAEQANGPIPRPVAFDYIWGDAMQELRRMAPAVRLINLETAVTTHGGHWPGKGVQYRMHPNNIACLTAARVDCCALANNHVLDWGYDGLAETLVTLSKARVRSAGAGSDIREAEAPAILEVPGRGRVLVFAFGSETSGIPLEWAAGEQKPGIALLNDLSADTVHDLALKVSAVKRPGDIVVVSLHWGGNWGYEIPGEYRAFARGLVDEAGVDVIHGHSSHHVKGIEHYHGKLILYGCGDFINDYEGIGGNEKFRGDLTLMYFPDIRVCDGKVAAMHMTPFRIRNFRLRRASAADTLWLRDRLGRESEQLGSRVAEGANHTLVLCC